LFGYWVTNGRGSRYLNNSDTETPVLFLSFKILFGYLKVFYTSTKKANFLSYFRCKIYWSTLQYSDAGPSINDFRLSFSWLEILWTLPDLCHGSADISNTRPLSACGLPNVFVRPTLWSFKIAQIMAKTYYNFEVLRNSVVDGFEQKFGTSNDLCFAG